MNKSLSKKYFFVFLFIWCITLNIIASLIPFVSNHPFIFGGIVGIAYNFFWYGYLIDKVVYIHNYIFPKYRVEIDLIKIKQK